MRKLSIYACISISLLLLSGCSTKMTVQKVEKNTMASGYLYNLPMVNLRVDIKRQLTSCEPNSDIINTTALVSEIYRTDPNQWYAINYLEMSGMLKATDINITSHDNFMISGINSSVKDKSVETAQKALEGVAKIASTFLGVGIPKARKQQETAIEFCNTKTVQNLKSYKSAKDSKEKSDDNITILIEKRNGEKNKAKIADLNELIKKAQAQSSAQAAIMAGKLSLLTDTQTIYIDAIENKIATPSPALLDKWFTQVGVSEYNLNKSLEAFLDFSSTKELKAVSETNASSTKELKAVSETNASCPYEGVVYRIPYRDRLKVCSSENCSEKILYDSYVSFPQYGKLGVLEFKNGIGQNNSFTVSFSQMGAPLMFAYGSTAQGEKVSAAVVETVSTAKQIQLDALNHQQQLLEAQKKIIDTQKDIIESKNKLQEAEAK